MSKKINPNGSVTDTQGRVWRICAIPDGVTLSNGQTKASIEAQLREWKEKQKEAEKKALEKARRSAKVKREKARKEWEARPQILYTPMGNKR
jgi:hypothetical protein